MHTLVMGGTKGLGLEIAEDLYDESNVIVSGRTDPEVSFAEFREFDVSQADLANKIGAFVTGLPHIDTFVYAPGYFQPGHITDLSDDQVMEMMNVCGTGYVWFTKKLLEKQGKLDRTILVTSTSQRVPREFEPVYNFAKAGVGHYANGLSLDPRVGKVLVAAPSAMDTDFWANTDRDTSKMMKAAWVAEQIIDLLDEDYDFREAKILGAFNELPNRVEIVETR